MTPSVTTRTGHRPRGLMVFLTMTIIVGLVALVLSVQNAMDQRDATRRDQRERIESDLKACRRGNLNRQANLDIAHANEQMWVGIRDDFFPVDNPRAAELRERLDARLERLRVEHTKLRPPIDCVANTPGAAALEKEQP